MAVVRLDDGRWGYNCKRCGKPLVVMDNEKQAQAAQDLHDLAHRDDDAIESPMGY